ncbi:MAG TPA: hypothetical protein VKU02_24975 [Gemmataceae bacterium]|nr:hypothetical protein [Gemmataceae bacterium]
MKAWFGALMMIGLMVAMGLVVARRQIVRGQDRPNADRQPPLEIQQAELLDKIGELQAQKAAVDEQTQGLRAELRALAADHDQKLKNMEQREKAMAQPTWEYKVFTLADGDDEANNALARTTEEGWEYVGIVVPAAARTAIATGSKVTNYPAIPPRLLFKRVKK